MRRSGMAVVSGLLLAVACTNSRGDAADMGTSAVTGATSESAAETSGDEPGDATSSTDGDGETGDGECGTFLGCDDLPGLCGDAWSPDEGVRGVGPGAKLDMCSIVTNDCPTGEKCVPVDACGDGWDANVCVPVGSLPPGSTTCEAAARGPVGEDTCDGSSVCIGLDAAPSGVCVEQCLGPTETAVCGTPDTACVAVGFGIAQLCLERCDPRSGSAGCSGDARCVIEIEDMISSERAEVGCFPRAASSNAIAGDPCSRGSDCGEQQACAHTGWSPQLCSAWGCCVSVCTLGGTSPCGQGYTCVDAHDPLAPDLGYCSPA